MLPHHWRLASPAEFSSVYRQGRRRRATGFTWWKLAIHSPNHTRLGVVVSSRVAKHATERNLYRRRLWAVLRELKAKLPVAGYHFVITANQDIGHQSYAELRQSLDEIISQPNHPRSNRAAKPGI